MGSEGREMREVRREHEYLGRSIPTEIGSAPLKHHVRMWTPTSIHSYHFAQLKVPSIFYLFIYLFIYGK